MLIITTTIFQPELVYFEEEALHYPLGKQLQRYFREQGIEIKSTGSHNRVVGIPGATLRQRFFHAKRTLVVGERRSKDFETCKPSAHFQLPLATGCPGLCSYCYLLTNFGRSPYVRIYVNQEAILKRAAEYIEERLPETTVFEGAATSDPLAVEPYSGALKRAIEFFAGQPQGRFRFVTKFGEVASLLQLQHRAATTIRFSVNSQQVISNYERGTASLAARLAAARQVVTAGYPLGFMIAPIFAMQDWDEQYRSLLTELRPFADTPGLTFELISHRFTARAKKMIEEIFPTNDLPLEESERLFKWGQFGYGKYLYSKELRQQIEEFFRQEITTGFPGAKISYFI